MPYQPVSRRAVVGGLFAAGAATVLPATSAMAARHAAAVSTMATITASLSGTKISVSGVISKLVNGSWVGFHASGVSVGFQPTGSTTWRKVSPKIDSSGHYTATISSAGAGTVRILVPATSSQQSTMAQTVVGTVHHSTPNTMLDATFTSQAAFDLLTANPDSIVYGDDYGITSDPAGSGNPVAWFDSKNRKSTSNGLPRSLMHTPYFIKPLARANTTTDEYWVATRIYIPDSNAMRTPDQWVGTLGSAYGPPYVTSSPLGLAIVPATDPNDGHYLGHNRWQMGMKPDIIGDAWPVKWNTWTQVVTHFTFAYQSNGGFVEVFTMNDGDAGYSRVPLYGNASGPVPYGPMQENNNDGYYTGASDNGNYCDIGVYSDTTMTHRIYYGCLRVGTGDGTAVTAQTGSGWRTVDLPV